jgi:thiamine-phosphate pyrophosphorylase
MTLCLVTDRRQLNADARTPRDEALALVRWLEEAVRAGIDMIHIREHDLPARLLGDVARNVRRNAAGSGTRVVVNDRADVALAAGCDGVHVRGNGPDVERVRACGASAPAPWVIGRSVHSSDEARGETGADYLLFGAVFPSGPKPGRGIAALRSVVDASPAPVLAIGGMTAKGAAACVSAGAAGVAAISIFLPPGRAPGALGVSTAASAIRSAIDAAATGHLR